MAKSKSELLKEGKAAGLELNEKNTVAEITAALEKADKIQADTSKVANDTPKEELDEKATKERPLAKAGKRSAKSVAEAEEKAAKEERKAQSSEEESPKIVKKPVKPARSRLERRGKGYRKSAELVDKKKTYDLKDALELATRTSHVKFDASVELHVRLNVDPKQADQNLRDSVVLPAGTGKTVRVYVFAEDDKAKKAVAAGADFAGEDELLTKLEKGETDFDVLVATPNLMVKLAKHARLLGPKGLMPNPKSGTVTNDVEKAVTQSKAGKIEYRVDSTGIIHVGVGKVSFGAGRLEENTQAVLESIKSNKPSSIKGVYVNSITVSTTMGPGIPVVNSAL